MVAPLEPDSSTSRFHTADKTRRRPIQRSISGPSPLSTASSVTDLTSSMSGYGSTNSNRSHLPKSGEVPDSDHHSHHNHHHNHDSSRRDSHDLSLSNGGRVRDSLLDNLLLSFDKIGDGTFGNFDASPFFSNIDEVDDDESVYSRRGRSNSAGYDSQFSSSAPRQLESAHDYGEGSFGVTYERDTRSRGRGGLSSSHGYANGYETFESAPAPSIRTRNRTPSPPRSPRLVRRPSNKSIKSYRSRSRDQPFNTPPEPATLPPLPAFANPPSQATAVAAAAAMGSSTKSGGRPGFFRRVFGGGGSSNSTHTQSTSNSSSKTSIVSNPPYPPSAPNPPPPNPPIAPPPEQSQPVLHKKASFFRRRKKSLSDITAPPPVPALPQAVPAPIHVPPAAIKDDAIVPSPSGMSLRTAMNPYIRAPPRPGTLESTMEDRETAYLARNATIRTVASSDPVSPRRPSFFSESSRDRDIAPHLSVDSSGKRYHKEMWGGGKDMSVTTDHRAPSRSPTGGIERPQTSPNTPFNSRTFFLDKDEDDKDMNWPPTPPSRGILTNARSSTTGFLGSGKERQDSDSSLGRARESSVTSLSAVRKSSTASLSQTRKTSAASRENAIVDMKELERLYNEEDAKKKHSSSRTSRGGDQLELDTINLEPPRPKEGSWISGPSPSTPTVTLQKDGPGEEAEPLRHEEETDSALDDGLPEPSAEDNEMAKKIFGGDEDFIAKERAAAWLGDNEAGKAIILKAYMRLFDWSGVNILHAMRILCGRLILKGETQQVDRIIVAFAHRWCVCNPNHGFKSEDIVHTILYSLLLLNTDLHLAELTNSQRMTRGQFIKNTMATIRRGIQEAAATASVEEEFRQSQSASVARSQTSFQRGTDGDSQLFASASATFPLAAPELRGHKAKGSLDFGRESKGSRLSRIGNIGNLSPRILPEDHAEKSDFDLDGAVALVNAPIGGGLRLWETQLEIVLKDFYHSVKNNALPLHGAQERMESSQSGGLAVFGGNNGMLRRSPSTISKAPSEQSKRGGDSSKLGAKWSSKNRSRQRVYNASHAGSSRTSLEDRSMWSPSASSTWSKYTLDKTQTSMSVDSLGSSFAHSGDYQQSIGFAGALNNAIIREEGASMTSAGEDDDVDILDGDDALELEGAPWAKEGLLKHKHHLESVDKRAKNRGWTDCFAVIQRGYMRLFQFPSKSGKGSHASGGVVGGGNWTENAEPIGSFLLRQTLASALPPPGYSKDRPNVWALSLPSGAVHFFEVGTAEIVTEFVTTANYWSARLSKEPLTGGVSNVEYGWGECLAGIETISSSPPSSNNQESGAHGRASLQMSIRSSMDHGAVRPRLPGDKINIKDWSPPTQSMLASSLAERDQLKALKHYVENIEAELAKHNELQHAMKLAFSPRHPNSARTMANWEKKSSYLFREIIKFTTYIETLQSAIERREKVSQDRLSWVAAKKDAAVERDGVFVIERGFATTPEPTPIELDLTGFSTSFE